MQGSTAASVGGDVFLTGASGLMMQGASLGKVLSLGFGEGFLGSAAAQGLLNEDGEINWALAIGDGMFSAVMAGLVWNDISRKIEKKYHMGDERTVWDFIKKTQEPYPDTKIPRSFEIEINGKKCGFMEMQQNTYMRMCIRKCKTLLILILIAF